MTGVNSYASSVEGWIYTDVRLTITNAVEALEHHRNIFKIRAGVRQATGPVMDSVWDHLEDAMGYEYRQ